MSEENTPWEVSLDLTNSKDKGNYWAKDAVMAARCNEAINNVCFEIDHSDMVAGGEPKADAI